MAGGIDWFRWHHGCVTDEKFRLVGRIAKASVAEVIAVWARLLELASQNEDRGNIGDPDLLAVDCLLGLDDGKAEAIVEAMRARRMIDDQGTLTGWERRQPKREREDDSADRVRRHRERNANADRVTPCNATQRQETPRGEESREEKKEEHQEGALVACSGLIAQDRAASSPHPGPLPESWNRPKPTTAEPPTPTMQATATTQHPTPGIAVANHPPPLIDGPWPDDPATDDPVEWLRQHCVFGDTRRVRDPALTVMQIRNGFPTLDLIAVFREASDYLRSGQTVTAGYERHLKRTAQFAAERQAKGSIGVRSKHSPPTRKPPDNVTDADFAADFAAQEARRAARHAGS